MTDRPTHIGACTPGQVCCFQWGGFRLVSRRETPTRHKVQVREGEHLVLSAAGYTAVFDPEDPGRMHLVTSHPRRPGGLPHCDRHQKLADALVGAIGHDAKLGRVQSRVPNPPGNGPHALGTLHPRRRRSPPISEARRLLQAALDHVPNELRRAISRWLRENGG